jgi:hypothetical protein
MAFAGAVWGAKIPETRVPKHPLRYAASASVPAVHIAQVRNVDRDLRLLAIRRSAFGVRERSVVVVARARLDQILTDAEAWSSSLPAADRARGQALTRLVGARDGGGRADRPVPRDNKPLLTMTNGAPHARAERLHAWLVRQRTRLPSRVSRRNRGGPTGATPELGLSNASQRSRGPSAAREWSGNN